MSKTKMFTVAVFQHERSNGSKFWQAYTRDYNTAWPGCQLFHVEATSGKEAKKIAIARAKAATAEANPEPKTVRIGVR